MTTRLDLFSPSRNVPLPSPESVAAAIPPVPPMTTMDDGALEFPRGAPTEGDPARQRRGAPGR